ncbi:DODA-type extradiol aromatic ring-opening family dioxygenase [Haliangium ochraceum]|uniref:Extradiol ring-cleavage dioxygenase class III protein subunit B n=1 Tax=Haliangium ochraceum (strain DSM 14365 / JCM 11303 / SMP-2) TaxID=502025 RepID=D0LTU9_HALO1|nr:class III extradiol ring-cleavage dioxygenase [Haliangium ochraceum]ACY15793.1 Extradiol ring-cleavage dioxygenase class III protein subunit B [Haliangium ochraceum DSM 14365]
MPKSEKMPVMFIPHGGGPWPFVELSMVTRAEVDTLAGYLRDLPKQLAHKPKALLVISAHWETDVPTVMTAEQPPLYFDYYGFPPESYTLTWPAPGSPSLAARVRELLGAAGFDTASDSERGFDHGTFIPLKVAYPDADVPTIQLSLMRHLDPAQHLAMGRALAPLREEGVLIVGSGMSFHDLRSFFGRSGRKPSEAFDTWLREAATAPAAERAAKLQAWADAPRARRAHPREEHLLPLMVVAGAAGDDPGTVGFDGLFADARLSAFHYA